MLFGFCVFYDNEAYLVAVILIFMRKIYEGIKLS